MLSNIFRVFRIIRKKIEAPSGKQQETSMMVLLSANLTSKPSIAS